MNSNALKQKFFLISFLPAIAYWYLEEYYPIKIAVTGGLILAVLEIFFEYIFCKKVHTLSKFNFILILMMGGLSLLGDDGLWFKLTPYLSGLFISAFLFYQLKMGKGLLFETFQEMPNANNPPLPLPLFKLFLFKIERDMAIFILLYAHFMGGIAIWGTSNQWIFFKTLGQYLIFFLFIIFEIILIRRKMKKAIQIGKIESELKNFSRVKNS